MKRERLNIGLFVSNVDDPFDNAIVKGAMQGARELDANLIIFPGRYLKGIFFDKERTRDAYQYNTLFSYATEEHIDVLLISLGTVATTLNDNEKKIFLDMYHDIPVMLIASNFKGYPSVNFNNSTGLRDGINDLIENKGCTKIGFVSGPMTNMDAVERLKVYKDCLESHKIEVIEDRIVYGNFSQYCTDEVETLLGNDPELEAIVFANDAMAIGGYSVLKKHGRCIGSDIYVLGFDDSPCATTLIPNLSSVRADAVELGRRGAIEAVNYKMTGEAKKVYIDTSFIKRNSTGNEDDDTIDELDACGLRRCLSGDMSAAAKLIVSKISPRSGGDRDYQQFVGISCEFVKGFLEQIRDNDDYSAAGASAGASLSSPMTSKP